MFGARNIAVAAVALLVAVPVVAQQKVPVQFSKGSSSTTVKGSIKGEQYRDYLVNARTGQTLSVSMSNPDGRAYFNVMPPGSAGEATFIGSTEGNSYRGPIAGNGNTTVRVYQMRATGRRGEVANYTLSIGVSGGSTGGGQAAGGARPASVNDLVGSDGVGAIDALGERGFRSVDNFESGANGQGSVWWNPRSRQCVQMITVDSRVDSITSIGTHPKCR